MSNNLKSQEVLVSVIVPCYNEIEYVQQFLNDLLQQDFQSGDYEIIISDGMSDDGSRELLQSITANVSKIKLIDNVKRHVSHGLNLAIKQAMGDIIIRMDMHTTYANNYIQACVETLRETGAQNVGGPALTDAKSYLQKANAIVYNSFFSVGGAKFHSKQYEGWVDTVTYGCWMKETLLEIGLFDEKLIRNQDDELNYRLVKSGGKIWQSPKIKSWYFPRETLKGIFKQYFQYGYWKVKILEKHKLPSSLRQLIPPFFLLSLIVLSMLSPFFDFSYNLMIFILTSYFLISISFSFIYCLANRHIEYFFVMPLIYCSYHFGYGAGYLWGLADWISSGLLYSLDFEKTSR